jgi:hypothetical protein
LASEWELVETQYQKMLQSDLENLSQEADLNHFYSERRALNPPPPPLYRLLPLCVLSTSISLDSLICFSPLGRFQTHACVDLYAASERQWCLRQSTLKKQAAGATE